MQTIRLVQKSHLQIIPNPRSEGKLIHSYNSCFIPTNLT